MLPGANLAQIWSCVLRLRSTIVSACGNLALVAVRCLLPSYNMPTTVTNAILDRIIGPVTAEDEAEFEREHGVAREDVEELAAPPKRKRGPGKKNSA